VRLVSSTGKAPADVLVVVDRGSSPDSIDAKIFYNGASDASAKARARVSEALEDYRRSTLVEYAEELDEDESFLMALEIEDASFSSDKEVANHILALVLPILMIFMTALGAFYPALDATVGEKERGTLETTLLAPVARLVVVIGKYGAVMTLSLLSFSLNFAGMYLTFAQLSASNDMAAAGFGIVAIAIIALGAVLLAGFFSAAMMFVAFLAKSFKEGQAYVTPIYVISIAPFAVLADPAAHLTLPMSFIPVVNVALLFRDALEGLADPVCIVVTLLTSAALAAFALWLASRVLAREDIATGGEVRFVDVMRRLFGVRGKESSV
jgi:sodium transport system permease protein